MGKSNEMNIERALKDGDEPAFPLATKYIEFRGMSKREYIATQLLSGSISGSAMNNDSMVHEVIRITDRLLIESNELLIS